MIQRGRKIGDVNLKKKKVLPSNYILGLGPVVPCPITLILGQREV